MLKVNLDYFDFRYSITDAGCELAHKLEAADGHDNNKGDDVPFRIHQPAPPAGASPPRLPQLSPPSRTSPPACRLSDLPPTRPGPPRLPQLPDLGDGTDINVGSSGTDTDTR